MDNRKHVKSARAPYKDAVNVTVLASSAQSAVKITLFSTTKQNNVNVDKDITQLLILNANYAVSQYRIVRYVQVAHKIN